LIELYRSDTDDKLLGVVIAAAIAAVELEDVEASDDTDNVSKAPEPSVLSRGHDGKTSMCDGRRVTTASGIGSGSVNGVSLSLQTCRHT
jgi:hypothetical protein